MLHEIWMACVIAEQLQECGGESGRSTDTLSANNSADNNCGKNSASVAQLENCYYL
jgi:hypothetical protein